MSGELALKQPRESLLQVSDVDELMMGKGST